MGNNYHNIHDYTSTKERNLITKNWRRCLSAYLGQIGNKKNETSMNSSIDTLLKYALSQFGSTTEASEEDISNETDEMAESTNESKHAVWCRDLCTAVGRSFSVSQAMATKLIEIIYEGIPKSMEIEQGLSGDNEDKIVESRPCDEKKRQEISYAIKILTLLQQESLARIKTAIKKQCDPEVDEMVQRLIDLRVAVADYSVTAADQQGIEKSKEIEHKIQNITATIKTILPELEQLKEFDQIENKKKTNNEKDSEALPEDRIGCDEMNVEAN